MAKKGKFIGRLPDGREIRWASRAKIEAYPYELEEILEIIGHPEAIITDASSVADFFSDEAKKIDDVLQEISDHFGIETPSADEFLVDIAMRARNARKGR